VRFSQEGGRESCIYLTYSGYWHATVYFRRQNGEKTAVLGGFFEQSSEEN